ncbi:MAG: hypothetical protein ACI37U_10450 [Bacteroides sp.]
MKTRAVDPDDNAGVDRAIVEVYADAAATQKVGERVEVSKGTDGKFTFSIPNLNAGQPYTFLFWADNTMDGNFNPGDLKNVRMNQRKIGSVAYSLATTLTPEEISQSGVQLKHAVAKITMQTTVALTTSDEIWLHCPCYESFNVLTNSATGTSTNEYLRACYTYSAGEMMERMYLFGTEETQTLSIEYSGRPTQKVLTNVPVNPNKHIILKGDYASIGLTNANFSVTLDEDWGTGSVTTDF